ncbi:MAG TPA: DUF4965 domain-containing protein [Armatimonadota bacterium]|jgi:hypothetical protein
MPEMKLRPPAAPLVTHDPYFSIWSPADQLTDTATRHWTGAKHGLSGLVRIDGVAYRCIGEQPHEVQALHQTSVQVLPTRTIYGFEGAGVALTLSFVTPMLPDDLDLLSRPVTYLHWEARSIDGRGHDVSVYLDISGEVAVNICQQKVEWGRFNLPGLSVLRIGSADQGVLEKFGDDLRIDWGHLYLAAPAGAGTHTALADHNIRIAWAKDGSWPAADDTDTPRAANDRWPVLACEMDLGKVGDAPRSAHMLLAYDDIFALEHLGVRLRSYWRRNGATIADVLASSSEFGAILKRCEAFDGQLMADLAAAGGEKFALLCALAYRQCISAHKLAADPDGSPVFYSKENFSNGCINTVDVTYPSSPFFLLLQPELLKSQLRGILDYAASARWKFPFAPHDLGTYPLANGQVYGGGEQGEEDQMPVEECGNMLLMLAALAHIEGNADFSAAYWPTLTEWAEYLLEKGLDPENQLCTDDFAGHMAHNANLAIKAILGLAGFAEMAKTLGHAESAKRFRAAAESMAAEWVRKADDGDHYRLAFDKPGTWSQKYNLVWDSLLGLNVFPEKVRTAEVAYYMTRFEEYGLPLDSRKTYTKTDWELWTATMAEKREDFDAIVDRVFRFANETTSRVPLTDWYETTDAKQVGFQARSVVGGLFIPLLKNADLWRKWAGKAGKS